MFPFGVTFYPDQWPAETWAENFKNIKKAGFNVVRFGEMAWDWIEPQPGSFSFAELDRAMDMCAKFGIKVLLGIPTSQVPPWFHRKYPGSRPVAQDGTLYPEYGPRPNICKDNANYRKLAERLTKKIVSRYKNHPALLMWQVDNEPVYPPLDHTTANDYCHCEHSRRAFINWAKKKYGSLKKVNEVWGAKFWTNTFSSFDDITTPKGGIWEAVSPHIFLDWLRFKTDSLTQWIDHLAKIVKKIDPHHKVGTNGFIGICTRVPDHSILAGNLDWYGLDIYPKGGRMKKQDLAFMLDLWRGFTRGKKAEFHITELQGGQNVRWGCPDYVAGPEIDWWTKLALEHGAKAILYHAWRPPLFGAETNGFGILKPDGSPTKRLEVINNLAKHCTRYSLRVTRSSNIVIAYLRSSEVQTYQEQGPPRGIAGQWEPVRTDIGLMYGLDSIRGAYQLATKKEKSVDFIFEQDIKAGDLPYKTILLPNPYLLSRTQFNNLKKWVTAGGKLVTDARFGVRDENAHLYPNPLLEELLGVTYDHGEINVDGFLDVLEKKPRKYQLIEKKIGKGKVVYANFSLFSIIKKGASKWQSTGTLIRKIANSL
ncbi:MAG: beta-galactosidase [Candidatus Margulisbacteria bacterium]|nr:beta-galactosidase [Candidatus Margulisiibacteriota bacterium]